MTLTDVVEGMSWRSHLKGKRSRECNSAVLHEILYFNFPILPQDTTPHMLLRSVQTYGRSLNLSIDKYRMYEVFIHPIGEVPLEQLRLICGFGDNADGTSTHGLDIITYYL